MDGRIDLMEKDTSFLRPFIDIVCGSNLNEKMMGSSGVCDVM